MINKQREFVGIKLDTISLISLDSRAESMGMNRSEFIKYCINQEMERMKNESEAKAKLNDFERLMQTLIEINAAVHKSIDTTIYAKGVAAKGFVQIQKALIKIFPDKKELADIFTGEK